MAAFFAPSGLYALSVVSDDRVYRDLIGGFETELLHMVGLDLPSADLFQTRRTAEAKIPRVLAQFQGATVEVVRIAWTGHTD